MLERRQKPAFLVAVTAVLHKLSSVAHRPLQLLVPIALLACGGLAGCDKKSLDSFRQKIRGGPAKHQPHPGSRLKTTEIRHDDALREGKKGRRHASDDDDADDEGLAPDETAPRGRNAEDEEDDRVLGRSESPATPGKRQAGDSGRTAGSCPDGGHPVGEGPPKGLAQWCEARDSDGKSGRHGPYVRWHKSGQKKLEGNFRFGKAHGTFTAWLPSGQKVEERHYADGLMNGIWTRWDKTGAKIAEGSYKAGKKNGKFSYWDRSGRPKSEGTFRDDIKEGLWTTWHLNGQPRSRLRYEKGKKSGPAQNFYKSGQIMSQGAYLNDQLHGRWTVFQKEGGRKLEGSYQAGTKTGTWTAYRRDGQIAKVTQFEAGRPVHTEGGRNSERRGGPRHERERSGTVRALEQPTQSGDNGWKPM